MIVLVCGSRNWTNTSAVHRELVKLPPGTKIIHGGARGADRIAGVTAAKLGLSVKVFWANWDEYGRAAGFIRNKQMIDETPDLVIAFTENLATSRGTADTVRRARSKEIETLVFND